MPAASRAQARLYSAQGRRTLDFVFPLNPTSIDRSRAGRFPNVNLARHDAGTLSFGETFEWVGNDPQTIAIRFTLHARGGSTVDQAQRFAARFSARSVAEALWPDVEAEIATLDAMQDKDARTGEPPRMVFKYGPTCDLGFVESIDYNPKLWTKDGRRQWVDCSMKFKVLVPNYA